MRIHLAGAGVCGLAACLMACAARGPIPPVSNTMYDWDLPPVVDATPPPTQCPPLPGRRQVRLPDRGTPPVVECVDHYARVATDVLRCYESSPDQTVRSACEGILGRLWERLPDAIKHRLVDRYARIILAQVPNRFGMQIQVEATTSFPFPQVDFTVRVLRYRNGRAEYGLFGISQKAALHYGGQLAVHAAARYTAGDTYAYDVVFDEMVGNTVVWRKVVRTNWVTVS